MQRLAPVLPPVRRHQEQGLRPGDRRRQRRLFEPIRPLRDREEGIDHGVAHREDPLPRHPFPGEVGGGLRRGGEVEIRQHPGEAAVDLLGERIIAVVGAQTGFDVAHRNLPVEAGQ